MSLRRAGIVAIIGAVVVASIPTAYAVDLARPAVERARPAVERVSEPRRVHQPDAAERELLFRQFQDWLRTRGYKSIQLHSDVELAASGVLGGPRSGMLRAARDYGLANERQKDTRPVKKSPAEAGLRMSRQQ
jgi:hypothetical protein